MTFPNKLRIKQALPEKGLWLATVLELFFVVIPELPLFVKSNLFMIKLIIFYNIKYE